MGALISVAHEREQLTSAQRTRVAALGRQKLDERATAKRAWKSWRRSKDLHSLTLSGEQIRRLIAALGSAAPEDPGRLEATLIDLLGGTGDVAAVASAQR
jgi:CHAD domain-containing protein